MMLKRIESMLNKLKLKLLLCTRREYGSNKIKYIYERHRNSDVLIVVFSGFSSQGEPARFNYIRTLLPLKVNKLFILDDFGYQNRGSYYLTGRSFENNLQDEICALIKSFSGEQSHLVTAGSSKGGSAALIYGLKCKADAIIAGAPQYYIGTYLSSEDHIEILKGICGDSSQSSIDKLDQVLHEQIEITDSSKTQIYIHCSPLEHTYADHVQDLLACMIQKGFYVEKDLDTRYADHALLSKYFPQYLFSVLQGIVEK